MPHPLHFVFKDMLELLLGWLLFVISAGVSLGEEHPQSPSKQRVMIDKQIFLTIFRHQNLTQKGLECCDDKVDFFCIFNEPFFLSLINLVLFLAK